MIALGIIVGVTVMLVAYFLSMLGYFKLRQRKSNLKYGVEIGVLTFALLFSMAIKAIIIFTIEPVGNNFWQVISNVYKAVYSSIGGLTFEGLSDFDNQVIGSLLQCLYCASSLYASLMVLSVITAKVSYEIYSALRMFFTFRRSTVRGDTDFYIFSSVNPETVQLAHSITEHYSLNENPRRCQIVFTGANISAFDSKEELHREIMANGYYYGSYSQKCDGYDSVFSHLRIPLINDFFIQKPQSAVEESRIRFFALSTTSSLRGCESVNSAEVFDEIEALVPKYVKQIKIGKNGKQYLFVGGAIIDFYALSDNDINYEFYKRELYNTISRAIKGYDVDKLYEEMLSKRPEVANLKVGDICDDFGEKRAKIIKYLSYYFQVHPINEAYLSANDMIKKRKVVFLKDDEKQGAKNNKSGAIGFLNDSLPIQDNIFRTMVLGFGSNGQQALEALYQNTAYVNEKGIPSRLIADIYDPKSYSIAGIFGFNHPMFLCVDKGNQVAPVTFEEWQKVNEKIKKIYPQSVIEEYYNDTKKELVECDAYKENSDYKKAVDSYLQNMPKTFEQVKEQTVLPVIAFHSVSTFEHKFLTFLEEKARLDEKSPKCHYKAFIVALGDDEMNILTANALISSIMHEHDERGVTINPEFTRTIYVNIRNAKNRSRINWTSADEKKLAGNKVVIFGDSNDLFSYETIIDDSSTMKFDYGYNNLHGEIENDAKNLILGYPANLVELSGKIKSKLSNEGVYYDMRSSWICKNDFKKQSNYAVELFSPYYQNALKQVIERANENNNLTSLPSEILCQLLAIEHERWNRFHIANGWIFEKNRQDDCKEHNCICALDMLKPSVKVYDLTNVLINIED